VCLQRARYFGRADVAAVDTDVNVAAATAAAAAAAVGDAALTALCAFNRPNTLAVLRELVHRLLSHEPKVSAFRGGEEVFWFGKLQCLILEVVCR
jgi:hypothetical protein